MGEGFRGEDWPLGAREDGPSAEGESNPREVLPTFCRKKLLILRLGFDEGAGSILARSGGCTHKIGYVFLHYPYIQTATVKPTGREGSRGGNR